MAFPWIYENSFENPTTPFGADSESDTGSKLSVVPYFELARTPGLAMPYRGASCLMIDLRNGDTNDHTLTEGDIDIADTATRWFRFYLWLSKDFAATADDTFNLLELQQAGGTIECSLGLRITAATGAVEIGIGDGTAPTDFATAPLVTGQWTCVEWKVKVSTTGAGTQDLYVDGGNVVALSTLTNAAAVGAGVLGTQNTLATTTGIILIDQFVMDDTQVGRFRERRPLHVTLTESGHAFVGPGRIEGVELLSGAATDNVLTIYDTDTASIGDAQGFVVEMKNTANSEVVSSPAIDLAAYDFRLGCYVQLSGTNPRAVVHLAGAGAYMSEGGQRTFALRRTAVEVA